MLLALGTTSSVWDVLQSSLTGQSGPASQATAGSFDLSADIAQPESTATACSSCGCSSPLSSQTLGALIAAQSPSAVTSSIAPPSIDPTGGTGASASSGSVSGSTNTDVSSTDPQGQIAGASTTTITNADGSTTTSFTLADGAKITLVTPGPGIASNAVPSGLATSSYNLIEQAIQRDAQSFSANAPASLSVNV